MTQEKLRWGIMGAGNIAHKMAQALVINPDSQLVAVASKTLSKAQGFAKQHRIEAEKDYQTLVNRSDIDVIYIATTHNFHYDNACLALQHKKHLLIEKPFTINALEAQALVDLAHTNKCFMMEAIWVRFLPSMVRLKCLLESGIIGDIRLIDISFGGIAPPEYIPRLIDPQLAGGVTLDMGIYPITFINFLLEDLPSQHKSMCKMSSSGVDELAIYQFKFSSGCLATVNTSFTLLTRQSAMIYGSKGYVEFPAFQQGSSFTIHSHGGTKGVESSLVYTENNHENGFIYEVAEVVKQVRLKNLESPVIPLRETVATMQLMDEMRADWGFKYPSES